MTQTKLENLINPAVYADMLSATVDKKIKLAPLAVEYDNLVGQPGDELNFPSFKYIGDADDLTEGEAIEPTKLETGDKKAKVKEVGKALEITDNAVLSGLGDPIGESNTQIATSIAQKVDNDLVTALKEAVQTATEESWGAEAVQAALDVFGDEDDIPTVIFMNPKDAGALRLAMGKLWINGTELGANAIVNGVYGDVLGVQVIRTKKVEAGESYVMQKGALALIKKRETLVETDRDILKRVNIVSGTKHYAAYLYDPSKVVKLTVKDGEEASK